MEGAPQKAKRPAIIMAGTALDTINTTHVTAASPAEPHLNNSKSGALPALSTSMQSSAPAKHLAWCQQAMHCYFRRGGTLAARGVRTAGDA